MAGLDRPHAVHATRRRNFVAPPDSPKTMRAARRLNRAARGVDEYRFVRAKGGLWGERVLTRSPYWLVDEPRRVGQVPAASAVGRRLARHGAGPRVVDHGGDAEDARARRGDD